VFPFSEAVGCKSNVVSCLRGKAAADLVAMTQQFSTWTPVLDGVLGPSMALMPLDQLTAFLSGQYKGWNCRQHFLKSAQWQFVLNLKC